MKINPLLPLTLLLAFQVSAQETEKFLPNILPPPPETFSLGTYGNLPIGLFTGSANISLPLTSYKTHNLDVPIYLTYSNNGLKVDEHESIVGLGWNLNMGGIITRVVRDEPDEDGGYSNLLPKEMIAELDPKSPEVQEYLFNIQSGTTDSEDDLFFINVNGLSGKFHIVNGNEIQLVDNQNLKIELITPSTTTSYSFVATDFNGIKYFFDEEVQLTEYRVSGDGFQQPTFYDSSWYLNKIVHPNGDEIYFSYVQNSKTFISSQSQNMRKSWPTYQSYPGGIYYTEIPTPSVIYNHNMTVTDKLIDSIYSNNPKYGTITVDYQGDFINKIYRKDDVLNTIEEITFVHSSTSNGRYFLDKVTYKDVERFYKFDYIDKESFPNRLSFAQDHWGYYNGQNSNQNLIPNDLKGYDFESYSYSGSNRASDSDYTKKGMLEYIHYPTKGFTKLEYEANDYYDMNVIVNGQISNETLNVETIDEPGYHEDTVQFFSYDAQKIVLSGGADFNAFSCDQVFDTGNHHKGHVQIYCVEDQNFVALSQNSTQGGEIYIGTSIDLERGVPETFHFYAGVNKTYVVTLSVNYMCTRSDLYFSYYSTPSTTTAQNIEIAGIRVKKTIDYASSNDPSPKITRYYYSKMYELDKSSGDKGQDPFYFSKGYKVLSGGSGYGTDYGKNVNFTTSSLNNLYDTGNSNVYYKFVTISHGGDNFENGGEEIEFEVDRDYFGETIQYSLPLIPGLDENRSAPFTNFGWNNGDEKKRKIFDKDLDLINEKETLYETIPLTVKPQFNVRNDLQYLDVLGDQQYNCSSSDTTYTYTYYECTTDHTHFSTNPDYFYCIAQNANNVQPQSIEHSCYQLSPGTVLTHNYENQNITVTKYVNLSYYKFPKTIIEKTYTDQGTLTVTTENSIRDSYPFLNSIQSISKSSGDDIIYKYYYPVDLSLHPYADKLIEQSIISAPIKTESYEDYNNNDIADSDEILSSENIQYKDFDVNPIRDLILPELIQTSKGYPINLEDRIIFYDYDIYGHPLEVSKVEGIHTVYVWGYGNTLPIAKIENATYSQVQSYVANLQSLSDADDDRSVGTAGNEGALRSALNNLRNNLANAMVTTYTYDPLVGVTSITDPRGKTIYYEYDSFNRLKYVRDSDGNILSGNEYHYADQN